MIAIRAVGPLLLTAFVVGVAATLNAAEISLESAKTAAQAWIDLGYSMDCLRGKSAAEGETLESDGAKMHVVSLGGGGFMVMGADDLVQPVIAFSPNGEANAHDTKSPLWKILKADLAMRVRAGEAVSADESAVQPRIPLLRGATSSSRTETQRLWDRLLGGGVTATKSRMRLLSATPNPVEAVSDVRVAPLVKSRWGQENNSIYSNIGAPCYNYYTTNNYPCGCVATALAQIMRFHRFPLSVPNVRTKNCQVGTAIRPMTMMGGDYDYDNMPLVPEAYRDVSWYEGGATEAQRQAIGKLTYNCSVAMQTWWNEYESSSGGAGAASVLTGDIGYANAVVCACETDLADAGFRNRIICSNLDAGFPVLLGIVRHEVIADGYGYSGETLYTHINLGWSGEDNVWYALPSIATSDGSFSSEFVESVIYNIFPSSSGEIVSGRVLDDNGNPVVGADVTIIPDGSTATDLAVCATTGDAGIFSFVVPGGKSYVVNAVGYGITATMKVETGKSVSSRVTLKTGYCDVVNPDMRVVCGNVWGCDLVLEGLKSVEAPRIEPCGGEVFPATNVTIACATEGATVRYTTDGSEPTEESAVYSEPFKVASDMMIKARAFKYGWNPSSVVVAFFDYDEFKGAPRGGFYGKPIEISGEKGSTNLQSTAEFALEDDEPWHTEYYAEDRTCWYRWESPGSGTMTFVTRSYGVNPDTGRNAYFLSPVAVYEESESMPNSSSEQVAMNYEWDTNTYTTAVSFTVRPRAVYRIVGVISYPYDIPLTLTWSGDLEEPSEIVWTVAFDANGGVLSGEATRAVPHGSFLGELPDAMKDGYRFLGWCTEKVGGWKVSSNFTVEDDIVLHAQWERLNPFSEAGLGSEYRLPGGVLQMDLSSLLASVAKKGWKIAATGLPTGLKFDAAKNTFSGIATKEGKCTVTFTATMGSGKTAVNEVAVVTFDVVFPKLELSSASLPGGSAAGAISGGGAYPAGKKVTLKAMPDKGCVFVGWLKGSLQPVTGVDGLVQQLASQSASYAYVTTDEDVSFTAIFATAKQDADNISLSLNGASLYDSPDAGILATNIMCGVAVRWPLAVGALTHTSVKVTGLPSGLKFTDKPVTAKVGTGAAAVVVTNVPANTIYGAPSAASKVDKNRGVVPSEVKITVTTAGKTSVMKVVSLTVDPLPAWAIGNFEGLSLPSATATSSGAVGGGITMSVTAAGKISGKAVVDGSTWTFKSDSYAAAVTDSSVEANFSPKFTVAASATAGKETRPLELDIAQIVADGLPTSVMARAKGSFGPAEAELIRLPWADKGDPAPLKHVAAYAGAYSCAVFSEGVSGTADFTLDEKGGIKGSVSLPSGAKGVAFSTSALPMEGGLYAVVATSADAKTKRPAVCEIRRLIPNSGQGEPGVAYRNPGVVCEVCENTDGYGASGTVTVNPKYGQAAAGKEVSLTAKADKNSVFCRWEIPELPDGSVADMKLATIKFKVDGVGDYHAKAIFATKEEDKAKIELKVADEPVLPTQAPQWERYCGVAVSWPVEATGLSQTTVKATGLPAGLKLVQDKVTKAYFVAGVPTAASKVDKEGKVTPAKVVFTVTTAGKSTQAFAADWTIQPLPDWACGTFDGASFDEGGAVDGLVQALAVAANGKISGKVVNYDGTWTVSAASLDTYDDITKSFTATLICKRDNTVSNAKATVAANGARGTVLFGGCVAWQNQWKAAEWKSVATGFAKAPVLAFGDMSLKFASTGGVTAGGKFVMGKDANDKDIVYSASCSSTLIPVVGADEKLSTNYYRLFLFFPPKTGKFDGYATEVPLVWNGASFTLPE